MEMASMIEEMKAKTDEVYYGEEVCQEKSKAMLKEMCLPSGLLPLKDMEEFGMVRETGFVWVKQKASINHRFVKIGKLVNYSTQVTAYVEKKKMKKLTGVKSKELSIWIQLSDIFVDDLNGEKITFQIRSGMFRAYPISAFEVEDPQKQVKEDAQKKMKEV